MKASKNETKKQKQMNKMKNMNTENIKEKAAALAVHLGIDASEVSRQLCDTFGMTTFEADGGEYAIADDLEADSAALESIRESAWAFRAAFLSNETDLPVECFEAMQEKCEGSNDSVLKLIEKTCGLQSFVKTAVSCDGRGHFLSGDGEEFERDGFYIYRIN